MKTDQQVILEVNQTLVRTVSQLKQAEFCLRLYHEAWNGAEGDWHTPMRIASKDTAGYFDKFHKGDYPPRRK